MEKLKKSQGMKRIACYFKEVCKNGHLGLQRQGMGVERQREKNGADGLQCSPLFKITGEAGKGREGEVGFSHRGEGEEMKSTEQKARCEREGSNGQGEPLR